MHEITGTGNIFVAEGFLIIAVHNLKKKKKNVDLRVLKFSDIFHINKYEYIKKSTNRRNIFS